ncbi:MAG: Ig-like domain-containing protein [Microbacterium sp.]|uniref:Ig-like domain-containing protein n=1 Tax=Microbacterium sp. TaxID=51671 RepID=UPI00263216BE|nr:Ig-like domain-containing protein [Microbacterium sp.]MCX6502047.1 Ig-like domain-containing protein [Microbacterium sp.]
MANQRDEPRARRPWIVAAAITATVAAVAVIAVVWPGFDAQQTPPDDGTIWALQAGDGRRYARVNTVLGELDTVKRVASPSGIVQHANELFVYADGDTRFAEVNTAIPADLDSDEDEAFHNTPAGTVAVASAGTHIAYLTDRGAVYGSSLDSGDAAVAIDPYADDDPEAEDRRTFVASAITVDEDGVVYAYSAEEGRVIRADAVSGEVRGSDEVADGPTEDVQLTAVAGRWAMLAADSGDVWVRGSADPVESGAVGGVLQQPSTSGDTVYLADGTGLFAVPLDGSGARRVTAEGAARGIPAAPAILDDVVYAAWLPQTGPSGTLWTSTGGDTDLDYADGELGDDISPSFLSNGSRMILNETRSGWVWTLPDGKLVPSSQQWDVDAEQPTVQQEDVTAERVVDPKPPVAVDDAFGVRAGRSVVVPVLLASVEGLDPGFGTVVTTNEQQELVVQVAAGATGSATFRYRATDGTSAAGLLSEPATVTLTVAADDVNTAPVWCGVEGCLATWPTPEVVPGGTVTVDVREGWVDPEGDPIYVSSAVNQSGIGSLALDPQGTVTFQHPNPNEAQAQSIPIAISVSDARGLSTPAQLDIAVTPSPQLTAESFAVIGSVGQPLTVDVQAHVTGAHGGVAIRSATAIEDASGDIVVNSLAGSFVFTGGAAGSYVLQYVVADDVAEAAGTVRVTLVDAAQTQISTPPLTAFVRPGEDATIDVISAVTNPAGLVLLASDVRIEPDAAASLSVDLVGESMLRVAGTTDSGQPGVLGVVRYTVSDGTGNGYTTAMGEVTVVLLPAAIAEPPIAVDDAVTVRVGAQIDIPVLQNDTAPAGAQFSIDPSTITNDDGAGLAFATGRLLRYLAPDEAGTYTVGYTIYRLGFPDMTDTARVTITVISDESNSAPLPRTLIGRVLSGSTVSIPFDRFAVDPDGDSVALDRIATQPARGSAAVSATGDAILYTSAPGDSGQVSFTYQVRDTQGSTGTGEVRVGVLDSESDPAPVTYSDYLQVQVGAEGEARVYPADNDIDPAGGDLEVIDVRPNAEVGTAEYDHLESMLGDVSEDGEVTLRAGTELGTYSFAYTVRNAFGDTAIGLIVLKVVRDPVPDYPVVRDTTLTVETRKDFPSGVDVLDGKVSWNAGDPDALSLTLWGDPPAGVTASGGRIAGAVPDETLLIPFEVTGTTFDGTEVTSYGFLRVPGTNDLQLTLRASAASVDVNERQSVEWDMAKAVALPPRATIEVGTKLAVGGARAEATCEIVSGTVVRYTAGAGSPWSDSCTVPVRLEGQDLYTYLAVQVRVIAEDPQPELRAAALTVSPGASATYDLTDMTSWAGTEDWASLRYALSYVGDQFTVVQEGTTVTVTAKDASRPGRQEPVTVTLPSHSDVAPVTLQLTVGPAPSTLPKGATLTQQCSQATGSGCTITVIGQPGEVNPLPGTPLRLVAVGATSGGVCTGVSFSVASATALQASWSPDADGTRCTVGFTVEDAQGRQSSGDRNGQVTLDLQGFPKPPNSVVQSAFADRSITLRVDPGPAANAYPALQGFHVYDGARLVTNCDASGACQPFTVDANGQQRTYEARAFNATGESRTGVAVKAWAYRPPVLGDVTVEPVYDARRTTLDSGAVRIRIANADPEVKSYTVTGASTEVTRSPGETTEVVVTLPVGSQTVTVTPNSANAAPDGSGSVGATVSKGVTVAGLPTTGAVTVAGEAKNSITVTSPGINPNGSARPTKIIYVAFGEGGDYSCQVDAEGTLVSASGGVTSNTTTISGLNENTKYALGACVSNGFGFAKAGTAIGWAWEPPAAPATATYGMDRDSRGGTVTFTATRPSVPNKPGFETVISGWQPAIGAEGSMTAKYCVYGSQQSRCGAATTVTAADPAQAIQARLYDAALQCVAGGRLTGTLGQQPGGGGLGTVGVDGASVQYFDKYYLPIILASDADPTQVPAKARYVSADVTFTWKTTGGAQYGVDTFSLSYQNCSGTVDDPEPTPTNTGGTNP